jgi:hypothetical protein
MKTFLTTIAMLCVTTMIIAQSGNARLGIRSHTLHPSDAE